MVEIIDRFGLEKSKCGNNFDRRCDSAWRFLLFSIIVRLKHNREEFVNLAISMHNRSQSSDNSLKSRENPLTQDAIHSAREIWLFVICQ